MSLDPVWIRERGRPPKIETAGQTLLIAEVKAVWDLSRYNGSGELAAFGKQAESVQSEHSPTTPCRLASVLLQAELFPGRQ